MTSNTTDNPLSFSPLDHAGKKMTTKREVFQAQMAAAVPWTALEAVIDRRRVGRAFSMLATLRMFSGGTWPNTLR